MTALVTGVGAALPTTIVGNDEFAHLGISDAWITSRTGIRQRRMLAPEEALLPLAVRAGESALRDAGRGPEDVDLVIGATITADLISPGLAPALAFGLGMAKPAALDVNAACTGFLYALDHACAMVESGRKSCVLVCAAEAASRIADRDDQFTAPLFGDAAGAVVVEEAGAARSCAGCAPRLVLGTDGSREGILYIDRDHGKVRMRGAEVYEQATLAMAESTRKVCAERGIALEDIDLFVPHQANARIIKAVLRELEVPEDRAVWYVGDIGNTSASSIPVSLDLAQNEGLLKPGSTIGMTAFGAGLTYGAAIIDWKRCPHAEAEV